MTTSEECSTSSSSSVAKEAQQEVEAPAATQEEENRLNSSSKEEDWLFVTQNKGNRNVPLGYLFHPSDRELIMGFLIPKILGQELRVATLMIKDSDLYAYEPDLLIRLCESSHVRKNQAYFFAEQRFSRGAGIVSKRVTKKGCWKASSKDVPVYNRSNELVGYKKVLIYYRGREPQEEKTCWTLYEYRVSPNVTVNGTALAAGNWVVCRIKYKDPSEKENEYVVTSSSSSSSSSSRGEKDETSSSSSSSSSSGGEEDETMIES